MQDKDSRPPGFPKDPEPPSALVSVADSLTHPDVTRVGLTTTPDGDWALLVRYRAGTPVPIEGIEALCGPHPVVYQEDPGSFPVARPAYPALGE
jgi:hypothetical protein